MQWPDVNTLFQEMKEHRNQKVGSEGTPELDPYWKLQPVVYTANMVLRSEFLRQRQYSVLGQNFSWIKKVCDEFEQQ